MPTQPLTELVTDQFRLSCFPTPGEPHGSISWWEDAVDQPPETLNTNPRKGASEAAGAFNDGTLVLALQPSRIDWYLRSLEPGVEHLSEVGEFPNLGPPMTAITHFDSIIDSWLARADLPRVNRIAFGAILRHPEASHEAAYLRLPNYVPVAVDPATSDFTYQINHPVRSDAGLPDLMINRLSKWSVAVQRLVALKVVAGNASPLGGDRKAFSLRIELDVNTSPQFDEVLPPEKLAPLYAELKRHAFDIAANGLLHLA